MKVYIAGRITGDPRYREKFAEAEAALREVGHIPLNPAVLPEGMEAEDYMRICTAMLDSADAIGLLGDWTDSPGAQLELHYANYVGKKTVDLWKMLAVRRSTEVRSTEVREESVGRVPADTDPALIAALRCSATVGGDKDCASCAYGCRVGDHMQLYRMCSTAVSLFSTRKRIGMDWKGLWLPRLLRLDRTQRRCM